MTFLGTTVLSSSASCVIIWAKIRIQYVSEKYFQFQLPTPPSHWKETLNSTYSFVFYSSHLGKNGFLKIFCTYTLYDWYGLCLRKLDETLQVSCVQKDNNAKEVVDNFCSSVRWYTQSAVSYWDTKCYLYYLDDSSLCGVSFSDLVQ